MKKLRVVLTVLIIVGVIGSQSKNLVDFFFDWRGRTIIYPDQPILTNYLGDAVVLRPVLDPPELSKKDEAGRQRV